jgi:ribosomal protein S18 acetylase RimI-like enzyme
MTRTSEVRVVRFDAEAARGLAGRLGELYAAAYRGTPQEADAFYSPQRFAERLRGYTAAPGFVLVAAEESDGSLVGYAFGYPLPANARWWNGLQDDVPPDSVAETGRRTFALCELHVRADRRGQGLATALHERLADTGYERLTVLVRPENPALGVYEQWGYRRLGRLKPFPDSPVYFALILDTAHRQDHG